ncbi:MAG TPA: TetR/AcrR family transcriptional regulator [Actinomycetota bacterium]
MELTAAQRIRADARDATRHALLRAGLSETVENGGSVPSIEAICARAGFTRGAFYVHFKSRGEFVVKMLVWLVNDIQDSLFSGMGQDGIADLHTAVQRYSEVLVTGQWKGIGDIRSAYMTVLAGLRHSDTVRERHHELMTAAVTAFEQVLLDGQKAGAVRMDIDPGLTATLLCVLSVGAMVWTDAGLPLEGQELGGSVLSLIKELP